MYVINDYLDILKYINEWNTKTFDRIFFIFNFFGEEIYTSLVTADKSWPNDIWSKRHEPKCPSKSLKVAWSGKSLYNGRSLVNFGVRGEIAGQKLFAPPISRRGTIFWRPQPLFNEWKSFAPPFDLAQTSSYSIKTIPKLVAPPPPLQHG